MKKKLLNLVLLAIPALGLLAFKNAPINTSNVMEFFGGPWIIYQADVLPDSFTPAFQTSSAGTEYYNTIVADPDSPSNNLLVMECPGTSFYWRMNFANLGVTVTDLTVAMRVKGNPTYDVALDLDLHYGDYRTRVSFHKNYNGEQNVARIRNGSGTNTPLGVNLDEWHTYRFTMDINATTPVAYIYVDESTTPIMSIEPASAASSNSHFRFGDGSSTTGEYGASIDWVVWDVSGAYSPVDLPLPNEVLSVNGLAESKDWAGPNPTKDVLYINHMSLTDKTEISVYDISGKLIKTVIASDGTEKSQIDLSGFSKGLYIVRYQNGGHQQQFKVLKE